MEDRPGRTLPTDRVQLQGLALGAATYLSRDEARNAAATVDKGIDRVWDLWARELGGTT